MTASSRVRGSSWAARERGQEEDQAEREGRQSPSRPRPVLMSPSVLSPDEFAQNYTTRYFGRVAARFLPVSSSFSREDRRGPPPSKRQGRCPLTTKPIIIAGTRAGPGLDGFPGPSPPPRPPLIRRALPGPSGRAGPRPQGRRPSSRPAPAAWRDMNVPEADGRDPPRPHRRGTGYTRALEIGTSTGPFGDLDRLGPEQDRRQAHHRRHRRGPLPRGRGQLPGGRPRRPSSTPAWPTPTSSSRPCPAPSTSSSATPTRTGTRTTSSAVLPKLAVGGAFVAHNVSPRG
ncbi:MAG: hypothetical protein MZU79_04515 [Anaerotruncus sp.]|nr:hypothetical protein [Anaerotruncus sp.]